MICMCIHMHVDAPVLRRRGHWVSSSITLHHPLEAGSLPKPRTHVSSASWEASEQRSSPPPSLPPLELELQCAWIRGFCEC